MWTLCRRKCLGSGCCSPSPAAACWRLVRVESRGSKRLLLSSVVLLVSAWIALFLVVLPPYFEYRVEAVPVKTGHSPMYIAFLNVQHQAGRVCSVSKWSDFSAVSESATPDNTLAALGAHASLLENLDMNAVCLDFLETHQGSVRFLFGAGVVAYCSLCVSTVTWFAIWRCRGGRIHSMTPGTLPPDCMLKLWGTSQALCTIACATGLLCLLNLDDSGRIYLEAAVVTAVHQYRVLPAHPARLVVALVIYVMCNVTAFVHLAAFFLFRVHMTIGQLAEQRKLEPAEWSEFAAEV